ncbi:MAG: hypothetical protein ACPGVD_07685 [Flavobacteriales bacterium]
MKFLFLLVLFSFIFASAFSGRLDPSDSASNKMFDSTVVVVNEIDSAISKTLQTESTSEDLSDNSRWFMYGFLALGAVLVILKFRGKL